MNGVGINKIHLDTGIPMYHMAKICTVIVYIINNALIELFSQYYSDAILEKLAPVENSQRNVSLNSVFGSKAPKIRFYGGSESNDYRVACAVAQTNIGHTYINRTLEAMGIESGSICSGHNLQLDKKRKDDSLRKKTTDFKRRRNHEGCLTLTKTSNKRAKHMKVMLV